MCLKNLFPNWFKPDPIIIPDPITILTPVSGKRILLLYGDNYPGTNYALDGCVNDINDEEEKHITQYKGFGIEKWKNEEVTRALFFDSIKRTLLSCSAGDFIRMWYSGHGTQTVSNHEVDGYDEALFLHDGPFYDDQMMELQWLTPQGVIFEANFDSCFSAGMAKGLCMQSGIPVRMRSKFHQTPGVSHMVRRVTKLAKTTSQWVIKAGCGEGQTSADAWFRTVDGEERANGAYTFYNMKCMAPGVALKAEMSKLRNYYLPGNGFDQSPELLGLPINYIIN